MINIGENDKVPDDAQPADLLVQWDILQKKLEKNEIMLRESMDHCRLKSMLDNEKSPDYVKMTDEIYELRRARTNLINEELLLKAKMDKIPMCSKPPVLLPKDDFLARSDDFNRRFQKFIYDYEDLCKEFAMIRFYEESRVFLHRHRCIVCIEASYFLQLWGIIQVMEKRKLLANNVVHQAACMEYILELGRIEKVEPYYCVDLFFNMIQRCTPQFKFAFLDDIKFLCKCFKSNARYNAIRNKEALAETARKARLSVNGIDPYEVLDKLPQGLRLAFQRQDRQLLHQYLFSLKPDVALKYIKSCIDVGIWVPNKLKEDIIDNEIKRALSVFFDRDEEEESSDEEDPYYAGGCFKKRKSFDTNEETSNESPKSGTHNHSFDEGKSKKIKLDIEPKLKVNLKKS